MCEPRQAKYCQGPNQQGHSAAVAGQLFTLIEPNIPRCPAGACWILAWITHNIFDVDLNVNVGIFHYKGRQGSNMRPRKRLFWVRESIFFATDLAKKFHLRLAKDTHVVCDRFAKVILLIREEWPFADKGI